MKKYQLSGDTKILCDNYISDLKSRENKETNIWNGYKYITATPYLENIDVVEYRICFSDGTKLKCGKDQNFPILQESTIVYKNILDLTTEDIIFDSPIEEFTGFKQEYLAYTYGYIFFNGVIDEVDNKIIVTTRNDNPGIKGIFLEKAKVNGEYYNRFIVSKVDIDFCKKLKSYTIPTKMFYWDKESVLNFISGYLDSSVRSTDCAKIYGTDEFLLNFKIFLQKYGILSEIRGEYLHLQVDFNLPTKFFKQKDIFKMKREILSITRHNTIDYYFYSLLMEEEEEINFNSIISS